MIKFLYEEKWALLVYVVTIFNIVTYHSRFVDVLGGATLALLTVRYLAMLIDWHGKRSSQSDRIEP